MAVLSLSEAAKAVGVSRQHLYRMVGSGKVSAVLRQDGTKGVDTSELLRVFGRLNAPDALQVTGDSHPDSHMRQQVTPPATAAQVALLELELKAAKDALQVAEERLRESQERENKLLELMQSQVRLLEHKAVDQPKAKTKSKAKPKAAPKAKDAPKQKKKPPKEKKKGGSMKRR